MKLKRSLLSNDIVEYADSHDIDMKTFDDPQKLEQMIRYLMHINGKDRYIVN